MHAWSTSINSWLLLVALLIIMYSRSTVLRPSIFQVRYLPKQSCNFTFALYFHIFIVYLYVCLFRFVGIYSDTVSVNLYMDKRIKGYVIGT